jgi:hypothetical protein
VYDTQLIKLPISIHELFEDRLALDFAEYFFLSEQFGHIFAFTKLSDNVEVIFCLEDIEQFKQIHRVSCLDGLQYVDFVIHELSAKLVFFLEVDHLNSYWLV